MTFLYEVFAPKMEQPHTIKESLPEAKAEALRLGIGAVIQRWRITNTKRIVDMIWDLKEETC